ncbi:hypothetical protein ES703_110256 [subsurface metagenome]
MTVMRASSPFLLKNPVAITEKKKPKSKVISRRKIRSKIIPKSKKGLIKSMSF